MTVDPTELAERLRDPGVEFEEDVAPLLAEVMELLIECGVWPHDRRFGPWLRRVAEATGGEDEG